MNSIDKRIKKYIKYNSKKYQVMIAVRKTAYIIITSVLKLISIHYTEKKS